MIYINTSEHIKILLFDVSERDTASLKKRNLYVNGCRRQENGTYMTRFFAMREYSSLWLW